MTDEQDPIAKLTAMVDDQLPLVAQAIGLVELALATAPPEPGADGWQGPASWFYGLERELLVNDFREVSLLLDEARDSLLYARATCDG